jgi:hypothetical protein
MAQRYARRRSQPRVLITAPCIDHNAVFGFTMPCRSDALQIALTLWMRHL